MRAETFVVIILSLVVIILCRVVQMLISEFRDLHKRVIMLEADKFADEFTEGLKNLHSQVEDEPQTEIKGFKRLLKGSDEKSCATCKHALGNWDGESNNCGRCCGADRRFYEPIEDEQQTEREGE